MCGITTTINHPKEITESLLDRLEHRGKDNRGIYQNKNVILGHNRLSINDLSESGNQPMFYKDLVLVVNGEIWNSPELREEYKNRGYTFQSNSDSEIILYLYEQGELSRLDGMFSFVIYDTKIDKLFVGRDWVGKIPLFISITDKIVISSELESIKSVLPTVVPNFVPVNSLITIDINDLNIDVQEGFYFKFSDEWTEWESPEEINQFVHDTLTHAVEKRLISDVPIATSLSGGIDSAVITYILSKNIPNLKAYTIKFEEDSEDLRTARLVAKHLGIELIEVEIPKDPQIIKDRFKEVIKVVSFPTTVQTQVGILQSFIAEQMAKDGIKVAFSGEGADESFGSYGKIRMFSKIDVNFMKYRKYLHGIQHTSNLLRGNNIFMKFGTIELRCPFYDTQFVDKICNTTSDHLSSGGQWKLPLAEGFRGLLPDEILDQDKRAFQKGTNFKQWIEPLLIQDKEINFNKRTRMIEICKDWFEQTFNYKFSKLKDDITKNTIYKWTL